MIPNRTPQRKHNFHKNPNPCPKYQANAPRPPVPGDAPSPRTPRPLHQNLREKHLALDALTHTQRQMVDRRPRRGLPLPYYIAPCSRVPLRPCRAGTGGAVAPERCPRCAGTVPPSRRRTNRRHPLDADAGIWYHILRMNVQNQIFRQWWRRGACIRGARSV